MDAIMRLSLSANPDVFYRLKEDPSICDVLMEFMRGKFEDELEKRTKEARAEGKAEGRAETEQELSANQAACVRVLMDRLGNQQGGCHGRDENPGQVARRHHRTALG